MASRRDLANAIRALSMDAVQKANSGHPGAPMGMADIAEVLWNDFMKHNPTNPDWADRDRFILSNGHGSMLIYSLLHLTGYELTMDDLKDFRQLHSKTPGHPEYGYAPGIETTTGPLGQGITNGVGMALAEAVLAKQFNREGHEIVDHNTYVFLGDGCMMEGITSEAASLVTARRQVLKILVTRGEGGHGYFPGDGETTRILYTRSWPQRGDDAIRAHLCRTRLAKGSPLAGIKSLNRLEQVLAARETQAAGCTEAILCDADGFLVEGLMSNLFWVSRGRLFTPTLEYCGVAGVMRDYVLEVAGKAGIDFETVTCTPETLAQAESVFLTNALGLRLVSECNGNKYDSDAVPFEITAAINGLLKQA